MAWNKSTWAERVRLVCIASIASAFAAVAIPATLTTAVEAKTPGHTYCFVGKCHRVKTIEETQALVGVEQSVTASHYDDCSKDRYNPCGLTSSGERFHPDRPDNTASPIYPDGTQLLVWSPKNKRALVVRVNNAGPYWGNRTLDLSRAAAQKLGFEGEGVADLKLRVIKAPEPEETRYAKNREYAQVPGDIGQYASLDDAQRGMAVVLAFKATTGSPFAPVTTANAFSGQSIGSSSMMVAEAPQAMGRTQTVAFTRANTAAPLAFGGFSTQSHVEHAQKVNQTAWDEDRVIDGEVKLAAVAEKLVAVTETSSIAAAPAVKKEEATKTSEAKSAKAKLAAAAYDDDEDAKPRKRKGHKRSADTSDKPEKSERRRSHRQVADDDDDRRVRSYRHVDREYRPRVAYQVERNYGSGGHSDGARSAGQTMSDNLRPL
jgi:rare lipoprotein A (peptidoglycan hydrolase)